MANTDITFVRPEQQAAVAVWTRIRDVCQGAEPVKAKGPVYLPLLNPDDKSKRNEQRNQSYRDRAVFYNITGNTKIGLLGMAFRKDPTFKAPDKLGYLMENADGAGTSIYQQSQQVLESVLEVARDGLYVDYAEETAQAIVLRYRAESIINWRTERVRGKDILVLVVLREVLEVPDGYAFKERVQYRELAMEEGHFVCRLWRRSGPEESGPFEVFDEMIPRPQAGQFWDEIPFTFVGAQNNDPTIDDSPLSSLVEINLGHYRNSADYEDSVWFCGQVQPYITGLDEKWRDWLQESKTRVGSRSAILLPVGSQYGYAQAQPNMLAKEAMDSKRDYMVQLGARLIEQNMAAKTATQASSEESTSTSVLGICVANVAEAYTRVLGWCARYAGQSDTGVSYAISQEFIQRVADSGMVATIVSAWQSGALRNEDMVRIFQKLDLIDPAANPDEVINDLLNTPPRLMGDTNREQQRLPA
ncbi:DUF4055 domain-containing protein [Salmonella enterica]